MNPAPARAPGAGLVRLEIDPTPGGFGPEGYDLTIGAEEVVLRGSDAAGLFYGVQTLRQLLPYWSEYEAILYDKPRPVTLPALHIRDRPRFPWRGAMLDVARHFFTVDEVKRYVDLLSLHKMNRLHLHLADDQGWRIEIKSWPDLTAKGGLAEVGGTPGGLLHAGAVRRPRRLRRGPVRHHRARDRHARPHQRGAVVVCRN